MVKLISKRSAVALIGTVLVVLVGVGLVGSVAFQTTSADLSSSQAVQPAADGGTCELADTLEGMDGNSAAPGNKPCRSCPRAGRGCTLISCDDCCYVCIGQPLPICAK